MIEAKQLGRAGEDFAAALYRDMGMEIVARNVRYGEGELDLVAESVDGEIVFVEVKTRVSREFGGAEAVTPRKLGRMRRAAVRWLAGRPYAPVRFDVLEIVVTRFEGVEGGAG